MSARTATLTKEGGIESEEILITRFQVRDSGRIGDRGEGSEEVQRRAMAAKVKGIVKRRMADLERKGRTMEHTKRALLILWRARVLPIET